MNCTRGLLVVGAVAVLAAAAPAPPLYEQLGGVYRIAPLVSDFVDRLWVNPTLLANPQYARRLQALQKPTVKFLLTSSVCHALGGPEPDFGQSLRGIPRAANWSEDDWSAVRADFSATLEKFKVAPGVQAALAEQFGQVEAALRQPPTALRTSDARGPSERLGVVTDISEMASPDRTAIYYDLGGHEGIAGFVDIFVGRMLVNQTVMANPDIKAAVAKATPAGLKYQLTAFLCEVTGGPERYVRHPLLPRGTTVRASEVEWNAMMVELKQSLALRKLRSPRQDRFVALVESVKREVVKQR